MEIYNPDMQEMERKAKEMMNRAKKTGVRVMIALVVLILGFDSVYSIQEQEQTVLITPSIASDVMQLRLRFKIPFVQNVQKVNTTIQGFALGYNPNNNRNEEEDSLIITEDYSFVNVDFSIEYKVADLVKAVYASEDPLLIPKNVNKSCIRSVISSCGVDAVLTIGKNEVQSNIKAMIIRKLEQYGVGLQVVNVTIQDSEPPTVEVMEAFKAVRTAKQGKGTSISNADKYRNGKLPGATTEVDEILQEAESSKTQRIDEANADVAKFSTMYEEYVKSPQVTKQRIFYETMEEVLPGLRVIIDGTGKTNTVLSLDSLTSQAGSSPANSQTASGQNTKGEE